MSRSVSYLSLVLALSVCTLLAAPVRAADEGKLKLEILEAKYGSTEHQADVLARLRERQQQYFIYTNVDNAAMGGDPAPDAKKELTLRLRLGKTEETQKFPEGSAALIVAPSDPDVLKYYAAQAGSAGVVLEARHGLDRNWSDWTSSVRAALDRGAVNGRPPLGLSPGGAVRANGVLVVIYLDKNQIQGRAFSRTDRVQLPLKMPDSPAGVGPARAGRGRGIAVQPAAAPVDAPEAGPAGSIKTVDGSLFNVPVQLPDLRKAPPLPRSLRPLIASPSSADARS